MAQMNETGGDRNRKHKKLRSRKQSLRVDLTPMVDLAFLLIAFFMLTTSLIKPMELTLDKRINTVTEPVQECQVLNLLVDSADRVYAYEGLDWKAMKETSFSDKAGVRDIIRQKTGQVKKTCGLYPSGKQREIICLIKLLPGSRFQGMISMMDEMEITKTGTYSLQEPLPQEMQELSSRQRLAKN